ncbi:glycosyltransferase [Prevotella sp. ne3005]|uniref:glycosyltransferase n=1 Tax=Prevotella sp. ne3005 TaxID=1761887 RepID=UPI000B83FF6A|nr:glycosyltransferase family 2 protein [Prevotella sp. ne3005]
MMWHVLHIIDITLWVIILGSVAYVAFFAIISLFYEKEDRIAIHAAALSNKMNKFLILYPAYNEDRVIINAVERFLGQKYPKDHYTVAVISDHMLPETNDYLRTLPITLLTPTFDKSSKAKAMQYAINEVKGDFDNVVILDADNVVRPEFLSQLNVLCYIYDAIQCHRCAKNANNDVAVLDGTSEEINNTIFRKAHNRLGLSSALIGSGMCFSYNLFKENVFKLSTAGEDREMEALLLHQEVFIKYAPDIHVFDEKVSNQENFQKQRMRWMTAQIQSLLSNLPKIPDAIIHGKINFVDKTIQQALIPRSILIVLLTGISIFITLTIPEWCEKWWALFGVLAVSLFIAIPRQLRLRSFSKVLAIPGLVLRMLKNILHLDRKNTDFIHTQHG